MHHRGRRRGVALAFLLLASLTLCGLSAAQEAARTPIVDADPGTPGLGGGVRVGSSPYRGGAAQVDLVPLYLYEGKWFYSHGTEMGFHPYRNRRFSFDLFARYRFLELDPDDDDYLEGLDEREQTVDGGLSFAVRGKWGSVRAAWMTDLLDRHEGAQTELTYRYAFSRGRWTFSPYVSAIWMDDDLSDYYFGVDPDEARTGRPEYELGSTFNLDYGLNTSYAWGRSIRVFANLGLREWDADIVKSPIVDKAITPAVFVGASYLFGNVYEPAVGAGPERAREWSWRVNFGYQADGNIVGEIDQGNFAKSDFVDSKIAGFTMARLVNDGPRVDFYGKAALFRHFEDGQDDLWSIAAYIMAVGKGYVAWTDRPFFRWGFGFGFNYAEEVPIVEQIKQGRKGRETNRFLNYLEMTLDFSLDAITRERAGKLSNCYVGLTTVHRSGIFATSDILGNVFGGSDWLTVHVECLR
jgi:outer membrane scaffolding protein for murein synthesis (MipA/OmpV family)